MTNELSFQMPDYLTFIPRELGGPDKAKWCQSGIRQPIVRKRLNAMPRGGREHELRKKLVRLPVAEASNCPCGDVARVPTWQGSRHNVALLNVAAIASCSVEIKQGGRKIREHEIAPAVSAMTWIITSDRINI
ncbi:hypothetical protein F2P81_006212 [Scophthalmus maximus]|uniref:Uncharacterized protein n=1 Tax=Scophthalmus maximus TaxID=52904 RepID=A0A6A4TAY2_SCOMX|nr:hypothetical protein F2P81_006212 [Scophthalmus maximus]